MQTEGNRETALSAFGRSSLFFCRPSSAGAFVFAKFGQTTPSTRKKNDSAKLKKNKGAIVVKPEKVLEISRREVNIQCRGRVRALVLFSTGGRSMESCSGSS